MTRQTLYLTPAARRLSPLRQLLALTVLEGMGVQDLAAEIKRSPSMVSLVLRGKRTSGPVLDELERFSGIPRADLAAAIAADAAEERAISGGDTTGGEEEYPMAEERIGEPPRISYPERIDPCRRHAGRLVDRKRRGKLIAVGIAGGGLLEDGTRIPAEDVVREGMEERIARGGIGRSLSPAHVHSPHPERRPPAEPWTPGGGEE